MKINSSWIDITRVTTWFKKPAFLTLTVLCCFFYSLQAQETKIYPGEITTCPPKFEDMHTKVGIPDITSENLRGIVSENATAEFQVTFGPGALASPEAMNAFQFALDIWANEIVSSVPIRVSADFANLGVGVLASAGPLYIASDFPNAPEPGLIYPAALANSIAGEILSPDFDFELIVNLGNGFDFYFGTDGNPGPGQFDFVTIALHEIGHGLGFTALTSFDDDTGIGALNNFGGVSTYSNRMVNGNGDRLTDFEDPSVTLGNQFQNEDLFVDGPLAVQALNGELPQLFAPNPFQGGSSISHWDETAFPAGDINSLMSPQVGTAESIFDIGDITRGHFRDMGWILNGDAVAPLLISPNSISTTLPINEIIIEELSITNRTDADVNISITVSNNSATSFIDFPDGTEYSIQPGNSEVLNVRIDGNVLPGGVFNEEITITVDGEDDVFTVPLIIQVLDGTEAPIISISPNSFNETVEQFNIITRDLEITNSGNADLLYAIDFNTNNLENFKLHVQQTNDYISDNGFSSKSINTKRNVNSVQGLEMIENNTGGQLITSLYATDFENFTLADVVGQDGWLSRGTNDWIISDANPSDGTLHIRGISNGLGADQASVVAISPSVIPADAPFMVASARINIQGLGTSWEFIPQSSTENSVVTRLRFNGDGTIDTLTSSGDFEPVNATTPEGYFDLKIVVDKDTFEFSIFFDEINVFRGLGNASLIDNVALISGAELAGNTLDIDNFEITDGDPNASFLSISPLFGEVPLGSSAIATVTFDARTLPPGEYEANINVESNDSITPLVNVPIFLRVLSPPLISVTPDSLNASIDVQTDISAVKNDVFTIINSGETPLDFTIPIGGSGVSSVLSSIVNPSNLDMKNYGEGNTKPLQINTVTDYDVKAFDKNTELFENISAITDSIFYDSGRINPISFVGGAGGDTSTSTALRFDTDRDFRLEAVRNAYRTEDVVNPVIILEIYKGGTTPSEGELLVSQAMNGPASSDGFFIIENLETPIDFIAGESFWVVHKYPVGIQASQGGDLEQTPRSEANLLSSDNGVTWSNYPDGFIILCRALNGTGLDDFIEVTPSSGSIAPGTSQDITVTFDASGLPNGVYNTDIIINNNDPFATRTAVATTLNVSGQISEIQLSDEFLLFNNVFLGDKVEQIIEITNTGLADITISDISSDNDDFILSDQNTVIQSGRSLNLGVTFTPSILGNINGTISINSDANNKALIDIVVNGVGVSPPIAVLEPGEIAIDINSGETAIREITLRNDGDSPLIYSFPELAVTEALSNVNVKLNNTEYIEFKGTAPLTELDTDTRKGNPLLTNFGIDSEFGYTWIDSNDPGGPVYNFEDITGTGTEVTSFVGRSNGIEVDLSFPFFFYGNTYTNTHIYADGFIAFQPETGSQFINGQIPFDDGVNNLIAAYWDNFDPQTFNGMIHFQGFNDRFIVQWTDMAESVVGNENELITFQIVLYTDGTIDVFYENVENASFIDGGTVGIENADGTDGAQVAFNTQYIEDNLALRFMLPNNPSSDFITDISSVSGVVPAGGSTNLSVTVDATGFIEGTFFDELTVSSNAPDKTTSTALFQLNVTGSPEIQVTPDTLSFDPIFVGLESNSSILIENVGANTLDILSIVSTNIDFVVEDTIASILPGNSITLPVSFSPSLVGDIAGNIVITSNDSLGNEVLNIPVTGVGVSPPVINVNPSSLDVTLNEEETITEVITVSNTGDSTLTFDASFVSAELSTITLTPTDGVVEPGESLEVLVEIATIGVDTNSTLTGDIVLASNDPLTPETVVSLSLFIVERARVVSFSLIDTITSEIVAEVTEGFVLDFGTFGHNDFTIVANTNDLSIGSVVFGFNGNDREQVENFAPYALAGDSPSGFFPIEFPLGTNTVTATPYSDRNGLGEQGFPLTVNFEVTDSSLPMIAEFILINAETNEAIGTIEDGAIINLVEFELNSFNIVANLGEQPARSVIFDFNGNDRLQVENFAPYALAGDSPSGFSPMEFPLGVNTVTATPYSNRNGLGDQGVPLSISFEVINTAQTDSLLKAKSTEGLKSLEGTTTFNAISVYPNPTTDIMIFSVGANNATNESEIYLTNLIGQVVYTSKELPIDTNGIGSIDMSRLAKGTYVLMVSDGVNTIRKKVIKN